MEIFQDSVKACWVWEIILTLAANLNFNQRLWDVCRFMQRFDFAIIDTRAQWKINPTLDGNQYGDMSLA